MKGVGYTNVNGTERIWDVADYVFPSQVGGLPNVMGRWIPTQVPNTLPTSLLSIWVTLGLLEPREPIKVELSQQTTKKTPNFTNNYLRSNHW